MASKQLAKEELYTDVIGLKVEMGSASVFVMSTVINYTKS